MSPYWSSPDGRHLLFCGDCLEILPGLEAGSVDAVVTDPPYELGFMGKKWDSTGIAYNVDLWRAVLRALKPGGHLLAFGGTRTHHRMVCAIEDAGFEIRDEIQWLYGSGFPKSLDIGKAIDKAAGVEREVVGRANRKMTNSVLSRGKQAEQGYRPEGKAYANEDSGGIITAPATTEAKQWDGWGTAIKPSHEEICWATKPLEPLQYCAIMIRNLNERIESCRPPACTAARSSRPTQADSPEERTSTVPASAATHTGEAPESETGTGQGEDTSSEAGTSASASEAGNIALSTLLLWRNILVGLCGEMRTSTTSTASETITDWKTLSFCLSQITPDDIILEGSRQSGLSASAGNAARYFNAELLRLNSILELSVLAPAISEDHGNFLDAADASPKASPICVARKPLSEGTVAANVLKHGTGGVNVDGCRVGTDTITTSNTAFLRYGGQNSRPWQEGHQNFDTHHQGRWPANVIHDGSEDVLELFPETTTHPGVIRKPGSLGHIQYAPSRPVGTVVSEGDSGSSSRFYYCAKASQEDRGEGNEHATVKPTALMRYLCRLVTPPGGIVLDPFTGSGSTGKAAIREGFRFVGIELNPEYCDMTIRRLERELAQPQLAFDSEPPAADPLPATPADAATWWARNMMAPRESLPAGWQDVRRLAAEHCKR